MPVFRPVKHGDQGIIPQRWIIPPFDRQSGNYSAPLNLVSWGSCSAWLITVSYSTKTVRRINLFPSMVCLLWQILNPFRAGCSPFLRLQFPILFKLALSRTLGSASFYWTKTERCINLFPQQCLPAMADSEPVSGWLLPRFWGFNSVQACTFQNTRFCVILLNQNGKVYQPFPSTACLLWQILNPFRGGCSPVDDSLQNSTFRVLFRTGVGVKTWFSSSWSGINCVYKYI